MNPLWPSYVSRIPRAPRACTPTPLPRLDGARARRPKHAAGVHRAEPAPLAVHRFHDVGAAADAMAAHAESLRRWAADRRSQGLRVSDQDHAEEAFCLLPPHAAGRPLVLLGGMGPLAGALAFRRACERFGGSRAIVLYQACSVPDRTAAILADRDGCGSSARQAVVARLAQAMETAVALLPPTSERADVIMVCNSAHYFWDWLQLRLAGAPSLAGRLNLVSTVTSAIRALRATAYRRVLLLCTEGARFGRVFAGAARESRLRIGEPSPAHHRLLTRAIYDGVKALNDDRAIAFGTRFFERVLEDVGDYDVMLAGCTELPPLIEVLKARSTPPVTTFLSRVAVLDPMDAALDATLNAGASSRISP